MSLDRVDLPTTARRWLPLERIGPGRKASTPLAGCLLARRRSQAAPRLPPDVLGAPTKLSACSIATLQLTDRAIRNRQRPAHRLGHDRREPSAARKRTYRSPASVLLLDSRCCQNSPAIRTLFGATTWKGTLLQWSPCTRCMVLDFCELTEHLAREVKC